MRPKGRDSEEWLDTSFTPLKAKSNTLSRKGFAGSSSNASGSSPISSSSNASIAPLLRDQNYGLYLCGYSRLSYLIFIIIILYIVIKYLK